MTGFRTLRRLDVLQGVSLAPKGAPVELVGEMMVCPVIGVAMAFAAS